MTRLSCAIGALAICVGVAAAAPKRKVKIETEPAGATVYLNAKEDGPVCTTPCTIDAPVGDTPIIVELENHKQLFENLVVPARKAVTVKYKLVPAIGTISIKGPPGAQITVDDEDKGRAPAKFEVGAGAHTVVLKLDGKTIATEFVEVLANEEISVDVKNVPGAKRPPQRAEVAERSDDSEEETTSGDSADASATSTGSVAKKDGPYIDASVAAEIGFRDFEYENATGTLTPEKERGQVLVGPVVDVYPLRMVGLGVLRGLFIRARYGHGVNQQVVKEADVPTSAKTFWRSSEVTLRYRQPIKNTVTLELATGWVRDQYQFEGMRDDIDKVPDADYSSFLLGVRLALIGTIEPYAAFENRFVISGGALEDRFDKTSTTGLRAAVGAVAKVGAFKLRVEGAINRYAWTFENTSTTMNNADGGIDSIKLVTAAVGYTY